MYCISILSLNDLKTARYISNEKIFIQEKLMPWLTYNPVLC